MLSRLGVEIVSGKLRRGGVYRWTAHAANIRDVSGLLPGRITENYENCAMNERIELK